jgi:hypothetical protein
MRKLFVAAATVAIFALLVTPAFAAPQKPSGTLAMNSSARIASVARGQSVGFDATYQGVRGNETVRLQVICMQNGSVVYGDNTVLTGSPGSYWFVLGQPTNGTSVWASGPATCRSDLYVVSGGNKVTPLAWLPFEAT